MMRTELGRVDRTKIIELQKPDPCMRVGPPCSVDIDWKLMMTKSDQIIKVRQGGEVVFTWDGHHNVAEVDTLEKYKSCDMTGATILSPKAADHDHSSHDHRWLADKKTYTMDVATAGSRYIVCEVNGHCSADQKIIVTVEQGSGCSAVHGKQHAHMHNEGDSGNADADAVCAEADMEEKVLMNTDDLHLAAGIAVTIAVVGVICILVWRSKGRGLKGIGGIPGASPPPRSAADVERSLELIVSEPEPMDLGTPTDTRTLRTEPPVAMAPATAMEI